MNHIYKSIFNKALGVFTAVPEFASAHGKGSERTVVGRVSKGTTGFAASALAISVGLALTSTSAVAAPGIFINNGQDPACLAVIDDVATSALQLIYGGSKTIYPAVGVAAGSPLGTKTNFELDARNPCLSTGGTGAENHNTQTNRTLFYNNKNLTLGGRLDVNSGIIGVGDRGTDGVGATNSIRMGTGTTLDEANKKTNAISIGVDAGASALGSTAIGANAKARAGYSVALGDSAVSGDNTIGAVNGGGGAIAIGRQSMANNYNAIAIGMSASVSPAAGVTSASDGIAIGSETVVDNYKGIAVGAYSQAKGRQSTVIANNVQGSNYSTASGNRSQVYGAETNVSGNNSVAIGDTNTVASDRTYVMGNNINAPAGTQNSLAFGTRASVGGASSIAMGLDSKTNTDGSIAMGLYSEAGGPITNGKPGINATAIGTEAKALGLSAVAMGYRATVENGHDSIAIGVAAKSTNKKSTAIGTLSEASGEQSTVISNNYDAKGGQSISVASGRRSQIYGSETTVSGEQSVAIGDTNTIASARTYAIGNNINVAAGANDSLVFGTKAAVGGPESIALGNTANSKTEGAISIGARTVSGDGDLVPGVTDIGSKSISIGYESVANRYDTIAMGVRASTQAADSGVAPWDAVAIGSKAKATTYKALAIGAYSQATGRQSTVIGNDIQGQNSTASGTRSQILGVQSNVSGDNSVSIGDTNNIASARTYALGNNINVAAGADDSLAFGTRAAVEGENTIAMGNTAKAHTENSISIGKNSESGKVDKFDGKQSVAIGFEAKSMGTSTIAMGSYATSENGHDGVAIGTYAKTGNEKAITIGAYSSASGAQSIVIANNYNSDNSNNSDKSTATGRRAIVMGAESHATAEQALAIGDKNTVAGARTYAIGNNINVAAGADDSLAFGTRAAVGAANTVAIGANANAAQANSVALGAGSATSAAHTGAYTLNGSYTAAGLPVAANGTVSVGSAGKERQMQNVAAGVISATSTDAINGSQLYATNNYMNNFAGDVKTKLGGNAALGNDGHLTMTNIGGTGKDNVNDAIAAANTKVAAGENITVTPTTNADGSKTYTVATTKDLVVNSVKAGDTTVNKDGLTIAGGPSVKKDGINAGDKKITGVADGNVAAGSKEAVNGGQLAEVKAKADSAVQNVVSANPTALTANKVGNTVTLTPNFIAGDLVNADGTVKDPAAADEGKLVSAKTVADALKANHFVVDTKANGGKVETGSEADAKVGSGNKVTFEAGKNLVAQQTNTANGGATVNYKLSDTLENLVSVKSAEIEAGIGPNKVVLNNNGVKVGDSTLNDKGLTINNGPSVTDAGIDAGNKKITGVADGNVAAGSTDAVNGGQLAEVKAKADSAVQDVKSGDENALTAVKDPNTNIVTVTPKLSGDLVDADGNITAPATPADKGKLVTAGTVAQALANTHFVVDTKATDGELDSASQADQKVKAGNKGTLQAGKNLKAKQTNGTDGAQVEFSLKDSISLTQVTAGTGDNQVVLGNDGVQVGGNTYINKDGLNANNKPISNVADGVKPTDAVNKGQLDAVKGVADSAVKSVDVANGEQNLVVDNTDPKNPKLSLKKDLTVDSVKAGDSTLNTDGLTIAGGPSVKKDGINAGDKKITNVAPGAVTPTSKDAVNGSQLYNVADNVKDLIGPDAAIDPTTGKVTVADPTKGIGETGKGNIGDAIKHVNDAAKAAADTAKKHTTVEQGDNIVVEESLNADGGKHYKVSTAKDLNVDSVKAGDTTVNNDGVTIAGGPSVTKGGINAGGNTITNVADGVNPNDAVNKGQLDAVKNVADSAVKSVDVANGEQNLVVDNTDPKNPKLSLKKDLTVDSVKAGDSTLNNDGLTIAGGPSVKKDGIDAGDKKITNVAAGDVAENSKDAVNGGQLYDVAKNVADLVGPDAKIDPVTGKVTVTDPAKGIGETGKGNIGDAIKHVNDLAKNAADTAKKHTTVEQGDNIVVEESTNAEGGKHYKVSTAKNLNVDSVKAGDTTVNNDGVTINNGPSMTKDGINANNTKVTNVADGVDAADAVNKGQLDKVDTKVSNVAQNVVNVLGGDATVNGNGDITMSNIGETGKGNINDAIKSVNDLAKKAAAEKTSVKAKEGRSNVTVTEGVNAAGGHEYTVDVERSVTNAGSDYVTVTNNHDADSNTTTYTVDVSAKTKASLAKADSAVQGLTSKDGNLNFTKGANGNVEVSFNDNLNVKNVTTDRVQVANGPSMSKDGINAAGKAISNVANGNVAKDSKDAVNGGQLHETAQSVADVIGGGATVKDGKVVAGQNGIGNTGQNTVHGAIAAINQNTANNFNQIRGDLRKMDRDLRGGIAGALATAGLPQAFRPGKSMVAAAASTYRGQSGLAIGVSRISDNGKIILKVTGNTNSRGDFGGTIGAGYQW